MTDSAIERSPAVIVMITAIVSIGSSWLAKKSKERYHDIATYRPSHGSPLAASLTAEGNP